MPIKYIPFQQAEEIELIAKWGDITGVLTNQSDLANALASKSDFSHNHEMEYEAKNPAIGAHLDDTGNPHNISKYDINLSNVDNLKQLNRMPGDFRSFTSKSVINENDILLIEDSEDNDSKKSIRADLLIPSSKNVGMTKMHHFSFNDIINLQAGEKIRFADIFPVLPGQSSAYIKSIYYSLKEGDSLYCDLIVNSELLQEDIPILKGSGSILLTDIPLNVGDRLSIEIKDNHLAAKYLTIGILIYFEVRI